jgi:hypothetical protein
MHIGDRRDYILDSNVEKHLAIQLVEDLFAQIEVVRHCVVLLLDPGLLEVGLGLGLGLELGVRIRG